jgi:hypothetical protein
MYEGWIVKSPKSLLNGIVNLGIRRSRVKGILKPREAVFKLAERHSFLGKFSVCFPQQEVKVSVLS